MIRVLFVCLGNICRSPMAECIFKQMVAKRGLTEQFYINSAATSTEEWGNPIYPPARRKLQEIGVPIANHRAVQMMAGDYARYDLLIGMDANNLRAMRRIAGGDPDGKLRRLLDYTDTPGDVADPWYTDDFDAAYDDISRGCQALLDHLTNTK